MNTKLSFISWLEKGLSDIETFVEPEESAQKEEDKVIGTMSHELRRLYSFREKERARAFQMIKDHKKEHNTPDHSADCCEAFAEKMVAHKRRFEILDNIFWDEVRQEVEECPDHIGIRKGFQIVEVIKEEEEIPPIIGALLGAVLADKMRG